MQAQPILFFSSSAIIAFSATSHGAVLFTDDFESPFVLAGGINFNLPSPWTPFNGAQRAILRPTTTAFNSALPLAAPAGGNQYLELGNINTIIYRPTGITVAADTVYTLSAAIGNNLVFPGNSNWSIQLWTDSNDNGVFDGFGGEDTVIAIQSGDSATAQNPTAGDWALNSISFDSATIPQAVEGEEIFILLNNFKNGVSSYDNVSLSSETIPEPSAALLLILSSVLLNQRRRK